MKENLNKRSTFADFRTKVHHNTFLLLQFLNSNAVQICFDYDQGNMNFLRKIQQFVLSLKWHYRLQIKQFDIETLVYSCMQV